MSELFQSGLHLGKCAIDPRRGQIKRPDGTSHVTPKAMEILLCLARRPEELVEREELIQAGWGGGAHLEEELTRCIGELRHALGDHPELPEYIQTIPRRGYRLVAPVKIPEGHASAGESPQRESDAKTDGSAFWRELQRREVFRSSLAYAAVAWLLIEVFSVVGGVFDSPAWLLRVLVVMAIIGFPIVVTLSWAVQKTPSGLALDMPLLNDRPAATTLRSRKVDFVIIGALLIAISFLLYREFADESPPQLSFLENSIAVLPFMNLSANIEDEFIADGLAEELLNLLTKTKDLNVTSRTASFYYKDKDIPLSDIVKALGVQNIVEGSVQRSGDRVRVTVQLVDASTMVHRWSDTYDTVLPDLIEVRDTIAREVASKLETVITERGERAIIRDQAVDRTAYLLYLQARAELRKEHNDNSLESAKGYLEEAIEIDPRFAKGHAALCDVYLAWYVESGRAESHFENAERACHRATTLDDDLGEVYVALGNLYRESGRLDDSLLELGRALELDPASHDALYGIAQTLEDQGDLDAAELQYRRMTVLQPGYWHGYNALGQFLYGNSRYAEATENFKRVTKITPDNALGFNNLGAAEYMSGDYAAAVEAWESSLDIRPSNLVLSNLGLAAYYAGQYSKAAEMQQLAIVEAAEDFRIWGRLGDARRQLGEADAARVAYGNAIVYAIRAVGINPSNEEVLRYLSLYYTHTGDSAAAITTIEKARELLPENARVHYFACKVYLGAGDDERAALELEKAMLLGYSPQLAAADPDLETLRSTGRFQLLTSEDDGEQK